MDSNNTFYALSKQYKAEQRKIHKKEKCVTCWKEIVGKKKVDKEKYPDLCRECIEDKIQTEEWTKRYQESYLKVFGEK